MQLNTSVEEVQRIGPKYAKYLRRLGIEEVRDLLFHFPSRYEDYSQITPIANVPLEKPVTVQGKVIHVNERMAKNRRLKN